MEKKYTVYKRNGRYYVCDWSFNYLLDKEDIYETGINSYIKADNLASDLNFFGYVRN